MLSLAWRLRLHPIVGSNDPKPDPIYASLRLAFHPKCVLPAGKCIAQYRLKFQIIHCQVFFLDPPLSMVIGDEAGFSMNARVHSQNVREYAARGQQPNFDYAVPESRERLTVRVGLCGNGELIGPVFFDRSVSGPSYLQM